MSIRKPELTRNTYHIINSLVSSRGRQSLKLYEKQRKLDMWQIIIVVIEKYRNASTSTYNTHTHAKV